MTVNLDPISVDRSIRNASDSPARNITGEATSHKVRHRRQSHVRREKQTVPA
jgi:hypothetical protein